MIIYRRERRGHREIIIINCLKSLKSSGSVIPATAGIQHITDFLVLLSWTPAFAGVTSFFNKLSQLCVLCGENS
jgi:hypothetical protein